MERPCREGESLTVHMAGGGGGRERKSERESDAESAEPSPQPACQLTAATVRSQGRSVEALSSQA